MLENGLIDVGPVIPEDQPVFHFESAKEDEDEDLEDDYEPFPKSRRRIIFNLKIKFPRFTKIVVFNLNTIF